jgi:MFS family permease
VALGNRNLVRLAVGFGGWMAGEWAFLVLLSVVAYDLGGVVAVGLIGAIRVIPAALLSPFASWLADRVPRARLLAAVHGCWAVLLVLAAVATAADAPLAVLYFIVGLTSVIASAFRGTVNALLPQLVDTPEELTSANSLYGLVEALGVLAGPLAAGAVLARWSPSVGFAVVAVVYLVCAVVTLGVATEFRPSRPAGADGRSRLRSLLAGFPALTGTAQTRAVFGLAMAQAMMRGLLNVFVVTLSLTTFGIGESGAAQLFAAMGVGGLVGAVTLVGTSGRRVALPFTLGIALWGLPVVAIAFVPHPAVAWFALVVVGFGNAVEDVYGFTLLNRFVDDHVAGRAFGMFWGIAAGAVAAGSLLAPVLIQALTLEVAMAVTGGLLALGPVLLWRSLRQGDEEAGWSSGDVELLRRVPMFAVLTQVVLERMARATREVRVDQGTVVVRQGHAADDFYVVAGGTLAVTVDGRVTRQLGEGDCFGEIGLLHMRPRTATVTASSPSRLLRLDGPTFVAAVTGHSGAEAATSTLARDRLEAAAPRDDPDAAQPDTDE